MRAVVVVLTLFSLAWGQQFKEIVDVGGGITLSINTDAQRAYFKIEVRPK